MYDATCHHLMVRVVPKSSHITSDDATYPNSPSGILEYTKLPKPTCHEYTTDHVGKGRATQGIFRIPGVLEAPGQQAVTTVAARLPHVLRVVAGHGPGWVPSPDVDVETCTSALQSRSMATWYLPTCPKSWDSKIPPPIPPPSQNKAQISLE